MKIDLVYKFYYENTLNLRWLQITSGSDKIRIICDIITLSLYSISKRKKKIYSLFLFKY